MRLNDLAYALKVIGDEKRLQIARLIFTSDANICVSDIADKLGMNVAITSHHLHVLSTAGILIPKREGKRICYLRSKTKFVRELQTFITTHS